MGQRVNVLTLFKKRLAFNMCPPVAFLQLRQWQMTL